MLASALIRGLAKARLLGISIEQHGAVKRRFSSSLWVWLALAAAYTVNGYCVFHRAVVAEAALDFNQVLYIILVNSAALKAAFDFAWSTELVVRIVNLDFFEDLKVSVPKFCISLGIVAVFAAGTLYGHHKEFGRSVAYDVAIITITIFYHLFVMLQHLVGRLLLDGMNLTLTRQLGKATLTLDDIVLSTERFNLLQDAWGFSIFANYVLMQLNMIASIYLILMNLHIMTVVLLTVGIMLYFGEFLFFVDQIYQKKAQVIAKGRFDAVQTAGSFRELLTARDALDELEGTGPLTGLGFLDLNRGLVPAFLATTLTYIIALIQTPNL